MLSQLPANRDLLRKLFMAICFALSLPIGAALFTPPTITAQEAGGEGEAAVAPAEVAAPAEPEHFRPKSRFIWFLYTSGVIGFFIFCLSIYFVATIIRLFIELRSSVAHPPEEVAQCEALLASRDYQGIYNYVSAGTSFFSRLLTTGISELASGLGESREAMDRYGEAETVDMERKISMLAVIGTLGPMIGLVGTLKGMIASFAVIALSDQQLKASEVAEGISEALLLTFEGVALSVPAIYFYAFFRNRVAKISVETSLAADGIIRRMVAQAKTKSTPASAPVAARAHA